MADATKLHPDPATISADLFFYLLTLYPSVLEIFYRNKIKDSKKVPSAIEDDKWRYQSLHERLTAAAEKERTISKEDLERLVQWKVTHQTFRPFLLPLIRKNDPKTVKETIKTAFVEQSTENYNGSPKNGLPDGLSKSLKTVSTLQGVGPATAPLLCSVYDPVNVPFFEDELYEWLCPGKDKLKYNMKEYTDLFVAATKLRKRLDVKMVDIEKVGFVVGHLRALSDAQREEVEMLLESTDKSTGKGEKRDTKDSSPEVRKQVKTPSLGAESSSKVGKGEETDKPSSKKRAVVLDRAPKQEREVKRRKK